MVKIEIDFYNISLEMLPACVCSICSEGGHSAMSCPELYSEIKEPSPPQPTGPRGQGEDDD